MRNCASPMRSIRSTSIPCATISSPSSISRRCARERRAETVHRRDQRPYRQGRDFPARDPDRRPCDGLGLPAAAVPGGGDRRRALLGRRLSPAIRRCGRCSTRPTAATRSSSRSTRSSAATTPRTPQRDHRPHQRDHLQRAPARRIARRRFRRAPDRRGRAERAALPARVVCTASAATASWRASAPPPSWTTSWSFPEDAARPRPRRRRRPGSRRISTRSASAARSMSPPRRVEHGDALAILELRRALLHKGRACLLSGPRSRTASGRSAARSARPRPASSHRRG